MLPGDPGTTLLQRWRQDPRTKTLPVGLADSYASMRIEIASAYTTVFLIMIIPLLMAIQSVGWEPGSRRKA